MAGRTQHGTYFGIHRMDPKLNDIKGWSQVAAWLTNTIVNDHEGYGKGLTWRMCREQHTPRRVTGIMG